jgi:prepilin-type N-terminal cleavage/methylation domain-containing protein
MSKPHHQGFSLLEMTIVLVILALVMGGMLMPLQAQLEYQKLRQTNQSLTEIKDALIGFAMIHGRLPCPSYITNPAHADFGVEVAPCDATMTSDGYLPWRTLGVNETDAWRIKQGSASGGMVGYWRYRVDKNFTTNIQLNTSFANNLSIVNSHGNHITTTSERPVAIIYSTGKNLSADGENADYEATSGTYQSDVQSTHFDDLLIWVTRPLLMYRMVSAGKLAS